MGEGQIDVQHPDGARFRLESSRFTELIGQIMPSQILKGQRSDQHNEQPLSYRFVYLILIRTSCAQMVGLKQNFKDGKANYMGLFLADMVSAGLLQIVARRP
ncbi:hypothetical protein Bca52824_006516 [Brassica carinata]|uniref:Uncharacterized protein n=1 Tax=Brassica carinata TaxID=52824 RepID=A0A8X7W868_BRACI|nr:hypothetical protein Bca52824_006516 [Brassica carinata]